MYEHVCVFPTIACDTCHLAEDMSKRPTRCVCVCVCFARDCVCVCLNMYLCFPVVRPHECMCVSLRLMGSGQKGTDRAKDCREKGKYTEGGRKRERDREGEVGSTILLVTSQVVL